MKGKIHKILGVAVTVAMVLTLATAFSAPVAASPAETLNEWYKFDYPAEGEDGDWFYDPTIAGMRELTKAINGDLYVYAEIAGEHEILKSTDGGRSWEITGYSDVERCSATDHPGRVWDMVCSSIDEDIVYATDGCYVYKTDDAGDEWDILGKDSLETALVGACGCCVCGDNWRVITSIDVTYDKDDNPFVFIGTRGHWSDLEGGCDYDDWVDGDVYYIAEAGYPANWTSLNLSCYGGGGYDVFAIGCAPDWATTKKTFVVVSNGDDTHVIYTKGTICGWYEFAELLRNCDEDMPICTWAASRIGFPDDWEDVEVLFVGITSCDYCGGTGRGGFGGDVYSVAKDAAIDLNVAGMVTGCIGEEDVDIISLDVCGETDEAALIAGAFCTTDVFYSTDGGWSWDESEKDPTGERWTYVIWYKECAEGALAATWGCESAVSMACTSDDVEDVGESWNQISLIATDIDMVRWLGFSPGYVCEDTETMFMVTYSGENVCSDTTSVFRHDGEYWERVFLAEGAGYNYGGYGADSNPWWMLEVSPDFNDTNCVYISNPGFDMYRTTDAGCSWNRISFPCHPFPDLCAFVVVDEDTVIAGVWDVHGDDKPEIWKTDRHGARPWKQYDLPDDFCCVNDFALEPGYEDPGTLIAGDECCNVSISEDGGETWDLVGDFSDVCSDCSQETSFKTWVAFDPGYATNHLIYAAAGGVIARCEIDPDEDWADQEWEEICCDELDVAYGIAAVGDTALYVVDADVVDYNDVIDYGGVLRSVNPDEDDADDVVFERIGPGLVDDQTELRRLWVTCDTSEGGCAENVLWSLERIWADVENVWVYEDTLAAPVVLDLPVNEQKLTKTTEATLSWKELCGADCYEVSLWSYCAECPDEKLEVTVCGDCAMGSDCVACGPAAEEEVCIPGVTCCTCHKDTCIVVKGLDPGTKYYWKVRVCQCQPFLSKWSEERTFTTAMLAVPFVDLCSPACGSQDIILTPNFAWGAVDGATGYEVQLSTTETFTVGVVKGKTSINAWVCPTALEYATTYYWRVRAVKDSIYSDWTYCMFTTMPEPVPPTPPVVIEQVPPSAPPVINIPPAQMVTPTWIYAIIGVGAALAIVVIVLIVRTRRPPA